MNFLEKMTSKVTSNNSESITHINTIYDINMNTLEGKAIDFNDYKGKFLLFVNVASKCGFTGQYKDLQKLYDTYQDTLMIVGVPCNQFGRQESGTADQIQAFCERNYGVSFLMTEKTNVKGSDQHPLYQWLTKKHHNKKLSSSVKWNFQKYLVSPEGNLIDIFYSITKPTSSKITKHLKN